MWPGAQLDVVPVSEIPRRPRSIATIPTEPHDPAEILAYLQSGNPHLPTHDWKVVKVSAPEGATRKAIVVLNKESLAPLREKGGKVYYGFDSITLRVYRSDGKTHADTSSVKAEDPPMEVDKVEAGEPASSDLEEDARSTSGMVGEFFGGVGEVVDEDVLLESDPEDADITVVYDPDGEGDAN